MMITRVHRAIRRAAVACAFAAASVAVSAQTASFLQNNQGPDEPIVAGAPYSADAVTTIKMRMFDGTRLDRSVTAKIYRDSAGRVRRDQTIVGLDPFAPESGGAVTVIVIVDPVAGVIYTLNPGEHTAMRITIPGGVTKIPSAWPASTPSPTVKVEALGTKQIDGLTAVGTRSTMTLPAGLIGNDRPIVMTDEHWESTDLKVLMQSSYRNPQSGDVDYKLANIRRSEPDAALFTVPAGYKIMDVPTSGVGR